MKRIITKASVIAVLQCSIIIAGCDSHKNSPKNITEFMLEKKSYRLMDIDTGKQDSGFRVTIMGENNRFYFTDDNGDSSSFPCEVRHDKNICEVKTENGTILSIFTFVGGAQAKFFEEKARSYGAKTPFREGDITFTDISHGAVFILKENKVTTPDSYSMAPTIESINNSIKKMLDSILNSRLIKLSKEIKVSDISGEETSTIAGNLAVEVDKDQLFKILKLNGKTIYEQESPSLFLEKKFEFPEKTVVLVSESWGGGMRYPQRIFL